jgi:hypothetical protein
MLPRRFALLLMTCAGVVGAPAWALAEGVLFPGTRPLGSGGAMRALATGDSGPQLNPSGISLIKTYQVEGAYQYSKTAGSNDARFSAVDSTSALNLGGALNYTYHHESVAGVSKGSHLVGGSLSFPFADKIFAGASTKYVHFTDRAGTTQSGFTYDAGLTVRPVSLLSIGAVGYNLRDFGTGWLPRGVGGGIAVLPMPTLLFVFDTVYEKVYADSSPTDSSRTSTMHYMGGGELSFSSAGAIRAGGGWNGLTKNGYISAGFSALSAEIGALDVGLRQDVSGESKSTIFGISGRLFVPSI